MLELSHQFLQIYTYPGVNIRVRVAEYEPGVAADRFASDISIRNPALKVPEHDLLEVFAPLKSCTVP